MFAPDFPFQFFTLHAQIKFFKILQPSSFPLSCLRCGYIKKNTACFSGPSTVVCFLGARVGLCFAQSSPCTAHHSHRVIVLGRGMQGVTALLSELTLAEQTAVVKAQLQVGPRCHPGQMRRYLPWWTPLPASQMSLSLACSFSQSQPGKHSRTQKRHVAKRNIWNLCGCRGRPRRKEAAESVSEHSLQIRAADWAPDERSRRQLAMYWLMYPLTSSSIKTGRKDATALRERFSSQGRHERAPAKPAVPNWDGWS